MAGYDKFRNHMEEPDTFISRMNKTADNMKDEDKDAIATAAKVGAIGAAAVVGGVPLAVLGGALWALNKYTK